MASGMTPAAEVDGAPGGSAPRSQRRFLAPEVIQTSAMDCGPAALKCLLEGHGISVSYGRLREACQTSVDGTSIDTMETVARMLGLEAEQVMVPLEHLVAPSAQLLPAIAVVSLAGGMTHFVVVWRQVGPYLQLMDPARGRRWVRTAEFLRDLHLHTQVVDAATFQAFVIDPGFADPLTWRVSGLVGRARAAAEWAPRIAAAQADASWRAVARLDGATRAVQGVVTAGAVRRGTQAGDLLRALLEPGLPGDAVTATHTDRGESALAEVLEAHSCARAGTPDGTGAAQVQFTGAVLVRIAGKLAPAAVDVHSSPPTEDAAAAVTVPPELQAALGEQPVSLSRSLTALWNGRDKVLAVLAAALVPVAALGGIVEVLLARPLLSGESGGAAPGVEAAAVGSAFVVLSSLVLGMWIVEVPLALGARKLGRALDQGLRRSFLRKLPRLGDRYFSSRPVSDMAERAHLLHRVRLLPALIAQLGRCWLELALITAAIVWLHPRGAPIVLGLFVFCCVVPVLVGPALAERDLRLRTHSGSLTRFYVDALLGLSAAQIHRAERALMAEHGARLQEWREAGRDLIRTSMVVETVVVLVATLGAGFLVMGRFEAGASADGAAAGLRGGAAAGAGLLLLFFALGLPTQAARLMWLWRQLPDHRNVTLRLLEPLGAPEERRPVSDDDDAAANAGAGAGAAQIALEEVAVEAGGHRVLSDVSLTIGAGSHVAVVGVSGAGKSTLISLLLGFHVPVSGRVSVDGRDLNGESAGLGGLRTRTAWVEPEVQLWNQSLSSNICYGRGAEPLDAEIARALADVELSALVSRWPAGAQTLLGEGGGLLSGGEGQRVRLARELLRVRRPRLVLLDEPFRGLDGETRGRLMARMRARWAGATLIVATHDIAQTTSFERVLVIAEGRVVEDGAPALLAADAGSHYRALLDAEARVGAERWSSSRWRRWLVRDGEIVSNQ